MASAFSVNSMSFVVDKDINVTKITLDIKILETPKGKILLELLDIIDFRVITLHYADYYEITGFQACSSLKLAS